MAGPHRCCHAVHRAQLSMGERLQRELQLQTARRTPEQRDLLLAERRAGAGGAVEGLLQHGTPTLFAGVSVADTEDVATRRILGHGKVESKRRFPLFHAPDCGGELTNSPSALH